MDRDWSRPPRRRTPSRNPARLGTALATHAGAGSGNGTDCGYGGTSLASHADAGNGTDSGCAGSLVCFQRENANGNTGQMPPGCKGGVGLHTQWDICYDPADNVEHKLVKRGTNPFGHAGGPTKLYRCEGHCRSDTDCAGNLRCTRPSPEVPGCRNGGEGDDENINYCYDPNDMQAPSDSDFLLSGGKCFKQ